ncbi:MAG: hypothetical protein KGZ37_01900 [Nitrosarchaeum sp.]|nr:hypothetical protein [Nitrosarchaeum sp.]
MNKFDTLLLECSSCNVKVIFDLIDDIECDWGSHAVIQCPNCEELFSIDNRCPAFSSIVVLLELNPGLLSSIEKSNYLSKSHPC